MKVEKIKTKDYEDDFCIIRKSFMKTNSQLKDESSN